MALIQEFIQTLHKCRKSKDLAHGRCILEQLRSTKLDTHPEVGNYLVPMFVECGSVCDAQEIFDGLAHRNLYSWTSLILGYVEDGQPQIAFQLYKGMQDDGIFPSSFTLVALVRACVNLKDLITGQYIHQQIMEMGCEKNLVVGSTLVHMYVKFGLLLEAQNAFDSLSKRDVVAWNSLLTGYLEFETYQLVVQCYEQMQLESVVPNAVTYVCVLKACGHMGFIEKGQELHKNTIERGWDHDTFVSNILIDMYGKCRLLAEAQAVFDRLTVRNVVSWTTLIAGYAENSAEQEALKWFKEMWTDVHSPNAVTLACVLKVCGNLTALNEGHEVHGEIIQKGYEEDPIIGNSLVDMYSKCGSILEAQYIFNGLPDQNLVAWNSLIAGYVEHNFYQLALECFQRMQMEGVCKDFVTFILMAKACGDAKAFQKGHEVHTEIVKNGYDISSFLSSTLVDMYSKCGFVLEAWKVFDSLQEKNAVAWNALISGYAEHGFGEEVLNCFEQMRIEGISPTAVTFIGIMKQCSSIGALEQGQAMHQNITLMGLDKEVTISNSLVDMYAKCGSLLEAERVFSKLLTRDRVSWNSLIAGYAEYGPYQAAIDHYERMQLDLAPDPITITCALKACGNIGCIHKGQEIHSEILQKGLENDFFIGSLLILMYAKCGTLLQAQNVFEKQAGESVVMWNAMIAGYGINQAADAAVQVFEAMGKQGVNPDAITFVCILTACSRSSLLVKGQEVFKLMTKEYGTLLHSDHLTCIIDLFGRSGQLYDAEKFLASLPCFPSKDTWIALLSACQIHAEKEVGNRCFHQLSNLYPHCASSYMLMASMFTAAQNDMYSVQTKEMFASVSIQANKRVHKVGAYSKDSEDNPAAFDSSNILLFNSALSSCPKLREAAVSNIRRISTFALQDDNLSRENSMKHKLIHTDCVYKNYQNCFISENFYIICQSKAPLLHDCAYIINNYVMVKYVRLGTNSI